jgi:hypothetical protein
MTFEATAAALGNLMFGQCRQKACRRPAFLIGLGGERGPDLLDGGQSQLGEEQLDAGSVARIGCLHDAPTSWISAELVIKMKRRYLDGDVGNGVWMRREASAERVEIGQSSGIEFGVDGFSELGLAGPIMSQCQQPDHCAARLLLAATGQQRLEGALIGAAREELLTIDQVEQSHWFAAQGMDDVPVIDHMAVLAVGMWPAAAQDHHRRSLGPFQPFPFIDPETALASRTDFVPSDDTLQRHGPQGREGRPARCDGGCHYR